MAPFTDLERLAAGIYAPLLSFGFLVVNFILHYVLYRLYRGGVFPGCLGCVFTRHRDDPYLLSIFKLPLSELQSFERVIHQYQRTSLAFLCTSYLSVVQTVLQFFSCTSYGDQSYLTNYPAVSCKTDDSYNRIKPLFITLLVVVIALPVVLAVILYRLNETSRLKGSTQVRVVFGCMTEGYTRKLYFWVCDVM